MEKLIIYQLFPRIFTNENPTCKPWGTLQENGSGKLNDISSKVIKSLKDLGVNCLWLTGVIEHATKSDFSEYGIEPDNPNMVKGEAGSPYAIKDYYDIDPALAVNVHDRINEFKALIRRCHTEQMKVIIDFVPNHTARRYHSDMAPKGIDDFGSKDNFNLGFHPANNYYYITNQQFFPSFGLDNEGDKPYIEFPAKATGNDCFTAFCTEYDWYETVKLNYGHDYFDNSDHFDPIPDTWFRMLNILRYWAAMGVDGFRCDMVFMVPLEFWHWAIPQVKSIYPHIIFIGEIYDIGSYRPFLEYGKFDYLYDKVNLYDTLVGIETKGLSAARLTECWQTVDGIGDRMLNFLENHDEVRFASKSYSSDRFRVLPSLVTSAMISKGPFMIYYGQELGETAEENEGYAGFNDRTTIFDYWSLSSLRCWYDGGSCSGNKLNSQEKMLRSLYSRILNLCNQRSAIYDGGFYDLMYANLRQPGFDPHYKFAFIRHSADDVLLILVNFSDMEAHVRLNIPEEAFKATGMAKGEFVVKDLIWGKPVKINLSSTSPVSLTIGSADALILPIPKS